MERQLEEEQRRLAEIQAKGSYLKEEVDAEDIAEIVSQWTGIPVSKMMESERERLAHLEDELAQRVVGQAQAVQGRGRCRPAEPGRPG